MTLRLFFIALLVSSVFGFAQSKESGSTKKQVIRDTIIDGQSQIKKEIAPVVDSLSKMNLEDHQLASEIDEKWLEELYSTSLYLSLIHI